MELRPIPARDWADWYTQELCASFPACECKPLEAIRALAAEGRYELLGLYDGVPCWATPPCGALRSGRTMCFWTIWG